jgi:hypothetical protein
MRTLKDMLLEENEKNNTKFIFEQGIPLTEVENLHDRPLEEILSGNGGDCICREEQGYILCNQKYSSENSVLDISYEEYFDCIETIWNALESSPLVRSALKWKTPPDRLYSDLLLSFDEKQRKKLLDGIKATDLTEKQYEILFDNVLYQYEQGVLSRINGIFMMMNLVKFDKIKIFITQKQLVIQSDGSDDINPVTPVTPVIIPMPKTRRDVEELIAIPHLALNSLMWMVPGNASESHPQEVEKTLRHVLPQRETTPYDYSLAEIVALINRRSKEKYTVDKSLENKRLTVIGIENGFIPEELVSAVIALYNLSLFRQKEGVYCIVSKHKKDKLVLEDLEKYVHDIVPSAFVRYVTTQVQAKEKQHTDEIMARLRAQNSDISEERYRDFLRRKPREEDIFGERHIVSGICSNTKEIIGTYFYDLVKSNFPEKEFVVYSELSYEQKNILGHLLFLDAFNYIQTSYSPIINAAKYFDEGILSVKIGQNRRRPHGISEAGAGNTNLGMIQMDFIFPPNTRGQGFGASIPNNFGYQFPRDS